MRRDLELLVISDIHLGEETSVLCFPHGRRALWRALREMFDSVNELVLLGDIADRTLSSTSQIITQTNAFIETIGSAFKDIKRTIFVPGNHDHTLWTSGDGTHITPAGGELIAAKGKIVSEKPLASELLTIFFGYPDGSVWRALSDPNASEFEFRVANPIYARSFRNRNYIFTHGTHFRKDVALPTWLKEVADKAQLDQIFGRIEIEAGGSPANAQSLEELETLVTPFVDSLWPSSKSNPTSHSDQLWHLLTLISGKFGHKRSIPPSTKLFSWDDLSSDDTLGRIARLTPEHADNEAPTAEQEYGDGSIQRCKKYRFIDHAIDYAERCGLARDDRELTFVFGDTHDGGFGRIHSAWGDTRVYNTGGWVVHGEDHHPPCHLFAVGTDGQEYVVDVSFDGVTVDDRTLLSLASEDAENKKRLTSRVLSWPLRLFNCATRPRRLGRGQPG